MKKGDRIELVNMSDDPNPIPVGTKGTIERVNPVEFGKNDKFTQVVVKWDNGRTLMLCIPPDEAKIIS